MKTPSFFPVCNGTISLFLFVLLFFFQIKPKKRRETTPVFVAFRTFQKAADRNEITKLLSWNLGVFPIPIGSMYDIFTYI